MHVIIRSNMAGVHFGTLEWRKGGTVKLTNSRRLWSWRGANTLSHAAVNGCQGKFSPPVTIIVRGCDEIIEATEKAAEEIMSVPDWK